MGEHYFLAHIWNKAIWAIKVYYSQHNKKNIKNRYPICKSTVHQKETHILTFQKRNGELVSVQVIDIFPQVGIKNPGYKWIFQHDYILKTSVFLKLMDYSLFLSLMVTEESMEEEKRKMNRKTKQFFQDDILLYLSWK